MQSGCRSIAIEEFMSLSDKYLFSYAHNKAPGIVLIIKNDMSRIYGHKVKLSSLFKKFHSLKTVVFHKLHLKILFFEQYR